MHIISPQQQSEFEQINIPMEVMTQKELVQEIITLDESLRLRIYTYLTLNKSYGCISNLSKSERTLVLQLKELLPNSKITINLQQCPMILTELELLMNFSYNYIIVRNSTHNSNAYIYYDYFILKIPKALGQQNTLEIQNTSTQLYDTCFRSIQQWQDRHKTSFKRVNINIQNTTYNDALVCQNLMKHFKDISINKCDFIPKIKDQLLQLIQAEKENNQAKITELTPVIQTHVNQTSQVTNQTEVLKIINSLIIDTQICEAFKTAKKLVLINTFFNKHCFHKLSELKQIEEFKCVTANLNSSQISDQELKPLLQDFDFKIISNFSNLKQLTVSIQKNEDLSDLLNSLNQIDNKDIKIKLIFTYSVQLKWLMSNLSCLLNYQCKIICPQIVFIDQAQAEQVKNESMMRIFQTGIPQYLQQAILSSNDQELKINSYGDSNNNQQSNPQQLCSLKYEISTKDQQDINHQRKMLLIIQKYKEIDLDIKIIG